MPPQHDDAQFIASYDDLRMLLRDWNRRRRTPLAVRDDVISVGMIAAFVAHRRFDSTRNDDYLRYLSARAQWAMLEFMRSKIYRSGSREWRDLVDHADIRLHHRVRVQRGTTRVGGGQRPRRLLDVVPDPRVDSAWHDAWIDARDALGRLSERERIALHQPTREAQRLLGVSESRVSQLRTQVIERLRLELAA